MRSLLLLVVATLCSCNTTIETSHYARRCVADADCTQAFRGDVCAPCGCANTAINVSDQARYDRDVQTLMGLCLPKVGPVPSCAACPPSTAVCRSGACELASAFP